MHVLPSCLMLQSVPCRRQKHTLKAVAKNKLQQHLKDPAARLKRLQAQLSTAAVLPATTGGAHGRLASVEGPNSLEDKAKHESGRSPAKQRSSPTKGTADGRSTKGAKAVSQRTFLPPVVLPCTAVDGPQTVGAAPKPRSGSLPKL